MLRLDYAFAVPWAEPLRTIELVRCSNRPTEQLNGNLLLQEAYLQAPIGLRSWVARVGAPHFVIGGTETLRD
jgi:hypothetical protein